MTTKQQLGNLMWIVVFLMALTSPFWLHWSFLLGVGLMAIAEALRKEEPLEVTRQSKIQGGPKLARSKPLRTPEPLADPTERQGD